MGRRRCDVSGNVVDPCAAVFEDFSLGASLELFHFISFFFIAFQSFFFLFFSISCDIIF